MFLLPGHDPAAPAAEDESGRVLTYGRLRAEAGELAARLTPRALVFIFCRNNFGTLIGYLACLLRRAVPLLLDHRLDPALVERLREIYGPAFIWRPEGPEAAGGGLTATGLPPWPLHDDLALLITTSGSTGSPKLVRQSLRNLESNARSIALYLGLDAAERAITTLPFHYVYGLSVVNSHLLAGGTLLLTDRSLAQKEFWAFFRGARPTSLAGVPYTYELLKRLRFPQMETPSLTTLTQAGGKLNPDLHREFAEYALGRGRKFVVMYGAAEATARMAYLPPEKALEKCGSMGRPIPGGRFILEDEEGAEITGSGQAGELIYYGDNVTLGYAESGADLAKGDERRGRLATGDLARRDEEGYYYVVGRKNRFLKIFGHRLGLDETEQLLKSRFPDLECACLGRDDLMRVFAAGPGRPDEIRNFLAETTRLHPSAFEVTLAPGIPKNEAGKTLYARLEADHAP